MERMTPRESYEDWDAAEFLRDQETIVEYLRAALEENDPEFFVKAVGNVVRAKGMTSGAGQGHVGARSLHQALYGDPNPRLGTLMNVLDAVGVQLTVVAK